MSRIVGAVVAVVVLVAIALVWRPWESRQRTAQLLPPAAQPQQPATPLVSIDEMQSRMADDDRVKNAVDRAVGVLASSEKEPDFLEKDCESDPEAKDIYRGMMLSLTGYLLVMTDLRSGDYENYGFVPEDHAGIDPAPRFRTGAKTGSPPSGTARMRWPRCRLRTGGPLRRSSPS